MEAETEALLTYQILHQHTATVAAFFTAHGVHSGARIGVLARNSAAVILTHFAAAATRAVVVNCNVQLAAAELAHVLQDAHVEVVLADAALKERLQSALAGSMVQRIIWVGGDQGISETTGAQPTTIATHHWSSEVLTFAPPPTTTTLLSSIRAAAQPSDHYQIYYTSGTTGKPKAVALTHAMVSLHAVGAAEEMQLDSSDVWCHVAPMYHLVDAFAIYAVTLVGGRHVTVASFAASELPLVLGRCCSRWGVDGVVGGGFAHPLVRVCMTVYGMDHAHPWHTLGTATAIPYAPSPNPPIPQSVSVSPSPTWRAPCLPSSSPNPCCLHTTSPTCAWCPVGGPPRGPRWCAGPLRCWGARCL